MTTAKVTATHLKAHLGETAERAMKGERISVTRSGRPQYALVSAEDLERLEQLEAIADVLLAEARLAEGGEAEPWEDVKRELDAENAKRAGR